MIYSLLESVLFPKFIGGRGAAPQHFNFVFCKSVYLGVNISLSSFLLDFVNESTGGPEGEGRLKGCISVLDIEGMAACRAF